MDYTKLEQSLLEQTLQARDDAESSVSQLRNIAQENMDFYFGTRPLADTDGGPSETDKIVWNHVEGAVSQILPIFTSMENKAIKFTPFTGEDVAIADALTHHVSHSILYKNQGKEVLEDAIRESFINRIAWIKTTWEETTEADQYSFSGINKTQLNKLKKDHDDVVIESDEDGYSGYCIDYTKVANLKLDNIPLENMLFPAMTRKLDDLPYIGQKSEVMKSELYQLFDKAKVDELGDGSAYSYIQDTPTITNIDGFTGSGEVNTSTTDENIQRYMLFEHYFLTSLFSDGEELKWIQVFTVNDELMEYNIVKSHPFSPIVAVSHVNSLVGWSFADLLKDIQIQRTQLLRSIQTNNLNLAYPRYSALDGQYNVESLLNNVAGGVIEMQVPGAVTQFAETPIPTVAYQHLDWLGMEAQRITGVSEMNQGLDPNVMSSNNAAATVIAQMNAGSKRILAYARNISEGWKVVLTKAYDYIRENSVKIDITNINGKAFVISESQMKERSMVVTPVLGTDENTSQAQILIQLAERYKADPTLVKSYNSYAIEMMILDAMGIPNRHLILKDPATIQPSEQEIMQQQMQMQTMQLQLQQLQATVQNLSMDVQVKQATVQLEGQKVQLEQMKVAGDQQYNAENVITDRSKLDLEAQKIALQQLEIAQKGEIEAVKINMAELEMQHKATMDLANMMNVSTEIDMEATQARPVRFGN